MPSGPVLFSDNGTHELPYVVKVWSGLDVLFYYEITTYRYNKLCSYGKLAGKKTKAVLEMINQLVGDGYLEITGAEFPVLSLTSAGKEALRNGKPLPVGGFWEKLILPGWLSAAPTKAADQASD